MGYSFKVADSGNLKFVQDRLKELVFGCFENCQFLSKAAVNFNVSPQGTKLMKTCFPVSPKLHRQDESLTLVCPLSAIVKAPPSGNRKCQVLFFYRDFIRATWSLVSVIFGDVKLQRFWVYVKGRGRGSMPTFEYSPQNRILCISAVHCPVWRNLRGSIRSHLCCHLVDTEISSNLAEILIGGSNLLFFFKSLTMYAAWSFQPEKWTI